MTAKWVKVKKTGRIGRVSSETEFYAFVQFGSSGPFKKYEKASLERATREEVEAAGLGGVG